MACDKGALSYIPVPKLRSCLIRSCLFRRASVNHRAGGTLQFGASCDLSNNRGITLGPGGGTIDTQGFTNPSGYTQYDGISGAGDLVKLGSGTFFMKAGNTVNTGWKSNLVLRGGTWKIDGRGGLPYNTNTDLVYRPGQITFDGGTLQLAGTITVTSLQRGITIAAGGGTLDTQSFDFTWGGPVGTARSCSMAAPLPLARSPAAETSRSMRPL